MPFHPGCRCPFSHSVFRRSVADACRGLPLCFLFLLISAFLFPRSLTLDRRCFSMSSLRPSSLTGPSPRLYPAGAYCLRKVRDSNPRIVLTIAALAVRCFQPGSANLPMCLAILSQGLYPTTALHLRFSISPVANIRCILFFAYSLLLV